MSTKPVNKKGGVGSGGTGGEKPNPANNKKPVTQQKDNVQKEGGGGGGGRSGKKGENAPPSQVAQEQPSQQQGKDKDKQASSPVDQIEAAMRKKIDSLFKKIDSCKAELDNIKNASDEKREAFNGLVQEKKQYTAKIESLKEQKTAQRGEGDDHIEKLKKLREHKKKVIDDVKKMRDRLPVPLTADTDDAEEKYLAKIDYDIKNFEKNFTTGTHANLRDEKRMMAELERLNQAKRAYREYKQAKEAIKVEDDRIEAAKLELEKSKQVASGFTAEVNVLWEKRNEFNTRIEQVQAEEAKLNETRDKIRDDMKAIREQIDQERAKLKEHLDKKREEQREKDRLLREKEQQERERRKQKYLEAQEQKKVRDQERRERANERKKQELLIIPYQEELDLCDQLVKYLDSLIPKELKQTTTPSPASSSTSSPNVSSAEVPDGVFLKKEEDEGPAASKKKERKKQVKVTQDLKHNVEVFLQFERLSLAPPAKVADIEKSIGEVKARGEHFSKLSAQKQEERKKEREREAAEEAAKAAQNDEKEKEKEEVNITSQEGEQKEEKKEEAEEAEEAKIVPPVVDV